MRKILLVLLILIPFSGMTQTADDVVIPFIGLAGPGSRADALGQAYTGIANDYSAMYYNPAGLAHVTRAELAFGGTYYSVNNTNTIRQNNASYTGEISQNYFDTNNFSYLWPAYGLKLTLGVGYNAVAISNQAYDVEGPNFSETINEESVLGAYTLSGGYQLDKELSMGASFHLYRGNNTYTSSTQYYDNGEDITYEIDSDYLGLGLTLGILWAPADFSRTGISIQTPKFLDVDETYTEVTKSRYDYRIQSPPEVQVGQSFTFGNFLVSGNVVWKDWSLSRFRQDPNSVIRDEGGNPIDIQINNTIRSEFNSALEYGGGAEFLLPWWNMKLRGGAQYVPSYLRDDESATRFVLSGGVSAVLAQKFKIDFSYSRATWEVRYSSNETADIINSWSTVTFSYRF